MARKPKKELISQREYARRRGISHVAVQRAVKAGRIAMVEGKIDPDLADRQWRENTDQSKPRNRITGRPKHTRPADEPPEPMDLGGEDGGSGGTSSCYAKARAAREVYQAQLAKLEFERERGVLVRADEVRAGAFAMARKARDQLLAVPERTAVILAAAQDPAEVHRILDEEIERICQEIAADAERA